MDGRLTFLNSKLYRQEGYLCDDWVRYGGEYFNRETLYFVDLLLSYM